MDRLEIRDNNCYSVTWTINKFSYCWQKIDEAVASPTFSIFIPEETKWKLLLFPRGTRNGKFNFFLHRERDCNGADIIEIKYNLEILNDDGSILRTSEDKHTFCKNSRWGCPMFLKRNSVLANSKEVLLMRCRIKRVDEKSVESRHIFARTIIKVERKTLLWEIQGFSHMFDGRKKCLVIKSASDEELLKIDLFLADDVSGWAREEINLNIYPVHKCIKFFILQTFLLKEGEIKVDSGDYENCCEYGKLSNFRLTLAAHELMRENSLYLPNDVLSLRLEFAISTEFAFEGITKIDFGTISQETTNEVRENWRRCDAEEKVAENALITDLMSLYKDQSLCDAKLQTKTKDFPVHITILSARSPVFRRMFSTDMEEKLNGVVDVSDLGDETVHQLILYLYTNKLEELKWEHALQLYEAADKYAVISLKDQCSLFLKDNLNLKNACEALIISDLHQDESLKSTIQDFILKNAKDIFKSEEWKLLTQTYSTLALETALRNWTEE